MWALSYAVAGYSFAIVAVVVIVCALPTRRTVRRK